MAQNQLNVNEHRRAFQQHKRASANLRLQETFDPPRNGEPWWAKMFKWENLTVAGREVRGLVVTPAMGLTLFLAFAAVVGWMWRTSNDEMRQQRDILIELKTRLEIKEVEIQKIHNRIDDTQAHQAAVETVTNKELAQIKAKQR